MSTSFGRKDEGVFELLTELCARIGSSSQSNTHKKIPQKHLMSKMRSHAYAIILKKINDKSPNTKNQEPISDLWSYYFVCQQNVKNVAEHSKTVELKQAISKIRKTNFGDRQDNVYNVLRLLISLKNSVKDDLCCELFKSPFSFGRLDAMLPKPHRESFGSPEPYHYYPSHVFELPFSLQCKVKMFEDRRSKAHMDYMVESFDSKSYITPSSTHMDVEIKTFLSPLSLPSMTSTHVSPYSDTNILNCPRLTGQRDLQIPNDSKDSICRVSLASTYIQPIVKEVFRSKTGETVDIWELASQVDKDLPVDIWEVVSKMPLVKERGLIATSSREMSLWRRIHSGQLCDLHIVPERQFIRHVMYLIIGIETTSFPFSREYNCFYIREDLVLEGISASHIKGYARDLLLIGTYYKRLYQFAFNHSVEDHFKSKGLVYEAAREVIRRYLLEFRLAATEIYEKCTDDVQSDNCLPTLLQILYHMEALKYEIETIASIYKMINQEPKGTIPHGAELMSYLFNEISLVTHRKAASTMFGGLFSVCKVYFRFIERFIFEGELDDWYNEFFIRKDSQYVNSRSKRYWDKGFHITQSVAVPEFLRVLAKLILLCGKSLRLLKLCNPNDPLVVLISSDHPRVQCCCGFEGLERQQQLLEVYRTRCRFVSGEPASFEQLLLKREAERKAFAEMATLKQAETMEKIVAERKRLAQLIVAEKQHSLKVLEAAMAEAKEAKSRARLRERARSRLEQGAQLAADDVDAKLRNDERNKIMAYYSKLNIEVEKSQIHTAWKMKRLQLDQIRTQLLTTEERNLRREKLELEHKKNEKAESQASSTTISEVGQPVNVVYANSIDDISGGGSGTCEKITNSTSSVVMTDLSEHSAQIQNSEFDDNKAKSQASSDVFSALCNAAKTIFGGKKSDYNQCDNKKQLDAQGNVVTDLSITRSKESKTSSDVIGGNLDDLYDNQQFFKMREEAFKNKQKVMTHEFGRTDIENNQVKELNLNLDEENNIDTPFAEAKRNKLKVLGAEFDIIKPEEKHIVAEPRTDAQKEALLNKQKILGVEYNTPSIVIKKNEPANIAQKEALQNRQHVLGSDFDADSVASLQSSPRRERAGLTLNLKPYSESSMKTYNIITPSTTVTPGELFPQLDLETPTTADIAMDGATTSDLFTPQSEGNKDFESAQGNRNKDFLGSNGFDFSLMVDEAAESEVLENVQENSADGSHIQSSKVCKEHSKPKRTFFNLIDGTYNMDEFDPFGVKAMKKFSKNYFSSKMSLDSTPASYTHPAVIMEEVKKKPYTNIFASHFGTEEGQECITSDNVATLTACLQRSVMLPLTYQLEVVNNAMLTYFLVNLDMYEHLRSLKDYFFLMDGEFSNSICRNLFSKLTKTLNPHELLNFSTLHNILDKALGSSIAHVHKFSENLSFTITEAPLSFQHCSPDVLQCLSLTYTVTWPLNIIMSQEALLRYAKVFQFLIKMRRISWTLGEDFQELRLAVKTTRQQSRKLLRSPQYIYVQIYRHIMASLIRALDNYIVTTCILSSWTEFENDLIKARTLDDLYECHVVYIKKVLFRCLLNNRSTPVMKLLNDIFTVILKFSRVLKAGQWRQLEDGHFTHANFGQLDELFHLFEKLAKYLHKVVTKLMECGYQRHLVELLTMVNLNEYYNPMPMREEPNSSIVSVA